MSDPVTVVIGPKVLTGPGVVDPDLVEIALECIDDDLALVDDAVVPVDDLWRDVLRSAAGGPCAGLVLICPSWWTNSRVERVGTAARRWSGEVVVRRRAEPTTGAATAVELASELVVVRTDSQRHVIVRGNEPRGIVEAVLEAVSRVIAPCVEGVAAATVDVPSGFALLGADIARALRARGVEVTLADDRTVLDAARTGIGSHAPSGRWRPTPRAAAVVVAILTASALASAALAVDSHPQESVDATWLIEGRVAVEVPARWTVRRVTSGPGSARVQVFSPTNRFEAIHVTQSRLPGAQTLDAAAEVLRSALSEQPEGVFVDFTAAGERAHRAAVTYREIRADRRIDWTVLLDGGVRIAIGCQGAAGVVGPDASCDRAIHSAHAITPR